MTTLLLALHLLVCSQIAYSPPEYDIPGPDHVYPGGTIVVKLKDLNPLLGVYAFERVHHFNEKGLAFVAVEVDTKPGVATLTLMDLTDPDKPKTIEESLRQMRILPKSFGQWYRGSLRIRNSEDQAKRNEEIALMQKAYAQAETDSYRDLTDGEYEKPLRNITVTDEFGTVRLYGTYSGKRRRRHFNIQKRIPHGGVDLRAKTPLPVTAINSGKVLLAGYFSSEGRMVVLDHGSGVVSIYLHLSRIDVNIGDEVKKEQVIALTGATPGGTPPHLHFMVKLHGINVDPLEFIEKANRVY